MLATYGNQTEPLSSIDFVCLRVSFLLTCAR